MALNIQAVVSLDTQMFTAGIRGIEAQINQFAGLAVMQFGGVAQQISAMWGAFGAAGGAISALSQIVQAGASYEQQMMRVASYTQASGDELARLSSAGGELAAQFGFGLDQVGQSMASLALAGVETANMTDVLQASLLLASATLGDANQSAELITSTLKVFQTDMAKAGEVANLFAGAIASSPLDLQRLSDSMKYAGSTGAAFGMSMQQVVSEIAAFHQVGLRGQLAGTAFRGALLEMSAAASSAKGVVGSALQGWVPATEGLTGAVRRLNDAGADAAVVIQELGKRAGPGVAALMKLGSDAMGDLTDKIKSNSDVAAMHETQMQALAGQYNLLKGEIAALALKIYNELAPGFKEALTQVRGSVAAFSEFAAKVSGPVSAAFNTLLPSVAKGAATLVVFNSALKALNFVGLNAGANSFAGIINKARSNMSAAREQVVALMGENKKLTTTLDTLTARKAALSREMQDLRIMYTRGYASAAEYRAGMAKLGGEVSGVTRKITAANTALDKNWASLETANKAAGSFTMGLSKIGVGASVLGAAIAGVQIGQFISSLRVWGTDHTVHEWLSLSIAKLVDMKTTMADITGELSPQLAELQSKIKGLKAEGDSLANTFIEKMPRSLFYLSSLNTALADVEQRARSGSDAIKGWFDFDAGSGGGFSGILVQLREMGALADSFGTDLAEAFDPKDIRAFRQEITDLESEASSLKSDIQAKEDAYIAALRGEITLTTQISEYEQEINRVKDERTKASDEEKTILNEQLKVLREKLSALYKTRIETANAKDEAAEALQDATGRLTELNDRLQTTRGRLDEIAGGIASAKALQDALNAAWEEWEADEKAAAAAQSLDALAAAYGRTELSMDAARAGLAAIGVGFEEFVPLAEKAGVKTEQLGKNLQWMNKNQDEARGLLERLGVASTETTRFMALYGDKCFDVARNMQQLGLSEEEAARKAGVFGNAVEQNNAKMQETVATLVETHKGLTNLASISGARMERLIQNITKLGNAIGGINGGNGIDLSWLSALGTMVKLPRLTGIDSWLEKFDSLATGVQGVANRMGGVDLSWVDALKGFSLPGLGDVSSWKKDFDKWVGAFSGNLPDIERFAAALTSLQGSLSALDDATLKIVFKDEAILSKIETHLSTLASLKGVIWA